MPVEPDAAASDGQRKPQVSIVVPARDEAGNIAPLVAETAHVMSKTGLDWELVLVDDASRDTTADEIRLEVEARDEVRGVRLEAATDGRGHGQSAALCAGLAVARGALLVTLDADLQNDPAEIPRLVDLLTASGADMVQGDRSGARRDPLPRKWAARVGYMARRAFLEDTIRDTGCSLRVFRREVSDALPLQLRGMHRFVPFIARLHGYSVIETPVAHRPRQRGVSKYGVVGRGVSGLRDLMAMRWMRVRLRRPVATEIEPTIRGSVIDE